MPSLKDIRKRIGSVKNTQQITKAMKMVAAAKLRRAQEAVENARPYAQKLDEVISMVVQGIENPEHPLLDMPESVENVDLIVIASDRGLCGGYNSQVMRAADAYLRQASRDGLDVGMICVGKRTFEYYRRHDLGQHIVDSFVDVATQHAYGTSEQLADLVTRRFLDGKSHRVDIVYTGFISVMSQVVRTRQLLPLETPTADENPLEHKYEPNRDQLLSELLPRQVMVQLLRAVLESIASEHGARMTAMDSASSNASDMIDRLTLQMNRARQAIITKELMEIVGGKEALEG